MTDWFGMAKAITRAAYPQNAKDAMIDNYVASAWELPRLTPARRSSAHGHYQEEDTMKVYTESRYIKHQDLADQDWVVTIKDVTREEIKGQDNQPKKKFVLHFQELEKGLILNTTNMNILYKILGSDDSEDWIGKRITLYCKDDIEMGGEIVSGVRVRPKLPL
jgi:hypothetical protein